MVPEVSLGDKERLFTRLIALKLLPWFFDNGYEVTLGEAWRPATTAQFFAKEGLGITHSLHQLRLAIDLNIYKKGKWLSLTSDFENAGEYWESLSTSDYTCCWGGRFNDGNHFSIEHEGVR